MRILKYTLARNKQVYFPLRYSSFLFTRFHFKNLHDCAKTKRSTHQVDLSYVIEKELLIHYSRNIHGIQTFPACFFFISNFIVFTDLIDKTGNVNKNVSF